MTLIRLCSKSLAAGIKNQLLAYKRIPRCYSVTFIRYEANPILIKMARKSFSSQRTRSGRASFFGRLLSFIKRSKFKWSRDDIWAFASWLLVGHWLFILVGTTTFASIAILVINGLKFDEFMARKVARYLSKNTGLVVSLDSSMVPKWKKGKISLRKLTIKSDATQTSGTVYDLIIDSAEISLSMKWFLEGRGLIRTCKLQGIRGTIDRRGIKATDYHGWKYVPKHGDFEIKNFVVEDASFTILNPDNFRPYNITIYSAHLPKLRKRYILSDIISAESIVGMFDGNLFNLHRPKQTQTDDCNVRFFKMQSLNVDFFSGKAFDGPLNWLTRGSVDIDAVILLPSQPVGSESYAAFKDVFSAQHPDIETKNAVFFRVLLQKLKTRMKQDLLNVDDYFALSTTEMDSNLTFRDHFRFNLNLKFHNLQARLPWSPKSGKDLISLALTKPLIFYINEQRPYVPISFSFALPASRFDGAWTIYESGLLESMSKSASESFDLLVSDRKSRIRRFKSVSLWSLSNLIRNLALGLKENLLSN